MESKAIYSQILESIRSDIEQGIYKPGDTLPSIRAYAAAWKCTQGTVQRAFKELEAAGLIAMHAGRRTTVLELPIASPVESLQRANLIHQAETFFLEALTAGHSPEMVEDAFRQALSRWRTITQPSIITGNKTLNFSGSHDLAIAWLASHFPEFAPGHRLRLDFIGSLPGLEALQKGKVDFAGSHLLDSASGLYNTTYIEKLFPGEKIALITLAHRRLGFMVKRNNPLQFRSIQDLENPQVRFVNRNQGSGTRVFLDSLLEEAHISLQQVNGYHTEVSTHSETAAAIAGGHADVGIGLEASAKAYGLDFIFLTRERYDLVMRKETFELSPVQQMITWMQGDEFHQVLERLGGYDTIETGTVQWT